MTPHPVVQLAFDGSSIDGPLFTDITDFARDTKWLNTPLSLWTNAGLGVFAVLMLAGWWKARPVPRQREKPPWLPGTWPGVASTMWCWA